MTTMVKGPYGMQFARITVPDVEETTAFLDYHVGLDTVIGDFDRAYLRAAHEHHSIELLPDPGAERAYVKAIGFNVEDEETLHDLRSRVEAAGLKVEALDPTCEQWVTEGFGVDDPNGLRVELFTDFAQFADVPFRLFRPQNLVHPFLATPLFDESLDFYLNVLGFRPSDYIRGAVGFLRSEDRYHHSLAIRKAEKFDVEHLCFIMQSLDHVMRGRARALYKNQTIASDLVNHSGSRSIAFYLHDPKHGPRYELCDGHVIFDEEQHNNHKPRYLSVDPRNIDIWRPAGDDWDGF